MSSRQQEKERRRQERLAAEAEAARREAARRRLQWVGGGILAVAAVGVLVALVLVPALGGDDDGGGGQRARGPEIPSVPIPPPQNTNLASSVRAAGCTLRTFPSEGREHSENPADWEYETNPPTSGTHAPAAAADGIYPPGQEPSVGEVVHALEHGRVNIQYRPGLPRRQIGQLQTLVNEDQAYHQLLFRNQTNMPFAVAATAWTQQLGCKEFNPRVFDALRNFRQRYRDQGPETVP